nr:TetR/AcrR family transcriptional regulator [Microbacterium bovistercoris]
MTSQTDPTTPVREPLQARSRASWERVLTAGRALLEEGGYEALTINEVCRRAHVAPPSIYARVDGRVELFRAVYERTMHEVVATEDELFAGASGSVADAIAATAGVFERHSALLRAIIHRAVDDPWLLQHGAVMSRRLQERVSATLPIEDAELASSIARLVYTECAFRTMYGPAFWSETGETLEEFATRITILVQRILAAPSP